MIPEINPNQSLFDLCWVLFVIVLFGLLGLLGLLDLWGLLGLLGLLGLFGLLGLLGLFGLLGLLALLGLLGLWGLLALWGLLSLIGLWAFFGQFVPRAPGHPAPGHPAPGHPAPGTRHSGHLAPGTRHPGTRHPAPGHRAPGTLAGSRNRRHTSPHSLTESARTPTECTLIGEHNLCMYIYASFWHFPWRRLLCTSVHGCIPSVVWIALIASCSNPLLISTGLIDFISKIQSGEVT